MVGPSEPRAHPDGQENIQMERKGPEETSEAFSTVPKGFPRRPKTGSKITSSGLPGPFCRSHSGSSTFGSKSIAAGLGAVRGAALAFRPLPAGQRSRDCGERGRR